MLSMIYRQNLTNRGLFFLYKKKSRGRQLGVLGPPLKGVFGAGGAPGPSLSPFSRADFSSC